MAIVEAVLALMAACIGFALLARRLRLPYAVILVLGGMGLAFVPGLPEVTLDPQIALAFFLPPLLQGSAYRTDWRAFRSALRPILLLAVGAVLFTALCVAATAKLLMPDLPWAAAIALGAIVAPPDAVAASAVLERLNLPRRIVTVLEGESLLNDATALVLYRLAVAAVGAGAVAPWEAAGSFFLVAAAGVLVGWLVGRATAFAVERLESTVLEITASFIACFASFMAAEAVHASGVISVVTTGLVLGQLQHRIFSSRTRLEARAVWDFGEFVLNSLVFLLVGLQLRGILLRSADRGVAELLLLAVAISAVVIVSRFVWICPTTVLQRFLPARLRMDPPPTHAASIVISWAGMRGVVSLAAALALPLDFPARDLIVFLAFCAILATLVLQGTTLEWLIRRLGVEEPRVDGMTTAEAELRNLVSAATLANIEARLEDVLEGAVARDLLNEYRDKARVLRSVAEGGAQAELQARLQIRLAALRAGRAALLQRHQQDGVHEELLSGIEAELDLEELRIRRLLGVSTER